MNNHNDENLTPDEIYDIENDEEEWGFEEYNDHNDDNDYDDNDDYTEDNDNDDNDDYTEDNDNTDDYENIDNDIDDEYYDDINNDYVLEDYDNENTGEYPNGDENAGEDDSIPYNFNNDNYDNNESDKEEISSLKELGASIVDKFKNINTGKITQGYDSFAGKFAEIFSKIPLLGKIAGVTNNSKISFRLFPLILIFGIIGILISISYITGPSKTSAISLPDLGEITVTSIKYNEGEETMSVELTNTGGVIIPVEETLTLYSYNPSLNPLSLTKFDTVGTCYIPEIIVETDNPVEIDLECDINENSKINYRVTASYENKEEE